MSVNFDINLIIHLEPDSQAYFQITLTYAAYCAVSDGVNVFTP